MSSSSVRTIERLRSEKFQQREKSWNSDVGFGTEKKRLLQMSSDIKGFILRSMTDPIETQRVIENHQRKRKEQTDSFSKLSETLGFVHHDGTDRNLELKVVKIIMIREGLIMNLQYLSERALKNKGVDGSNILELMFQLRETTLNYLEALCLWRQGSNQGDMPRAFLWESGNYTIKLIGDMDFLSDNPYIIHALNIPPEQLKSNPLMLSNNLEDFNTWMDPHERAAQDTNGNTSGPEFESRLRLRFAERVLLQEMELYNSNGESDIFITQGNEYTADMPYPSQQDGEYFYDDNRNNYIYINQSNGHRNQPQDTVMIGSNILEDDGSGFNDNSVLYDEAQVTSETVRSSAFFEGERRFKTTESAFPQSRSSTATQGFSSAPSTSHGKVFSSADHDYFSGNWNEGRGETFPFFELQNNENPEDPVGFPYNPSDRAQYEEGFALMIQTELDGNKDGSSVSKSAKSIDSVSDLDMRLIIGIAPPPTSLILAGSVCIILFSDKDEVPEDLSWKAFLRLAKTVDLPSEMSALCPEKVHKYKVIAIQPILEQLIEEITLDSLKNNNYPFQEYIAINRFVTWVKQFTSSAIRKDLKQKATSPFKEDIVKKHKQEMEIEHKKGLKHSKSKGKVSLTPIQNGQKGSRQADSRKSKQKSPVVAESLPKGKKSIVPKVATDLCPFHKELVEGKFKNAILLVLLTTADALSEELNCDTLRVVVKAYDIVLSTEAVYNVNMREHVLLQEELCKKYSHSLKDYYCPTNLSWWKDSIQHLINLKYGSDGDMKLKVSQKLIEEFVVSRMNLDGIDTQLLNGASSCDEIESPQPRIPLKNSTKTKRSTKVEIEKIGSKNKVDSDKPPSVVETKKNNHPHKKAHTEKHANLREPTSESTMVNQVAEPQNEIIESNDNKDSLAMETNQSEPPIAGNQMEVVSIGKNEPEIKEVSAPRDEVMVTEVDHSQYAPDFSQVGSASKQTLNDNEENRADEDYEDEFGQDLANQQNLQLIADIHSQESEEYENDFATPEVIQTHNGDGYVNIQSSAFQEQHEKEPVAANSVNDTYDDTEFADFETNIKVAEEQTIDKVTEGEVLPLSSNVVRDDASSPIAPHGEMDKDEEPSLYGNDFETEGNHVGDKHDIVYLTEEESSLVMEISDDFKEGPLMKLEAQQKKSSNQLEDEHTNELNNYLHDDKSDEYNEAEFEDDLPPPIAEIILSEKVKGSFSRRVEEIEVGSTHN